MRRPFVTIILAGGKGTRMGTNDKHKVCFEVLGVPVIIRALETYNLCGSQLNIVVVGMLAEKVMLTVNQRFSGTVFAFQEQARGTGDAARKGAEILERMRYDGDVLVVAGDKVIEPGVIRRLVRRHQDTGAAVTLITAKRPVNSSTGILLKSERGDIAGILEEMERQRLLAFARLNQKFEQASEISREAIHKLVSEFGQEQTMERVVNELWRNLPATARLKRSTFEALIPADERQGILHVGSLEIPADQILSRFDQMNLSTYLFRAPVLYEALHELKVARNGLEEYLTDVFEILSKRKKPAHVVGCEIDDLREVMAFNNPQELLAIEEVYRQKEGAAPIEIAPRPGAQLATPAAWENLLQAPSPTAQRQFRQWYGEEIPWQGIQKVLACFVRRYDAERPVAVIRSPGRINLLGRHIDHQGGTVNVMAINREIILVAAPRLDDRLCLANTDEGRFPGQTFRISDLLANLNWDDWQQVIDGPRNQRLLEAARGDWANYIKAAILRLQEQFRDRRLRGLDLMVGGDIPMGAGLSSSSALVVAVAEAVTAFNALPVSPRHLVSLCGEAEWFVGTRGGAADHAAIKLSRRAYVTRVGFFPFKIEDSARFLPDHDLVVCNSGLYAGKSHLARNKFNEKVTAYHIGKVWFKMLRPDLAVRIQHLRDLEPHRLGLERSVFIQLLGQLPHRITRAKIQAAFAQMAEAERDKLERLFLTHDAPPQGYPVRDVVLFGLTEMARARLCLDLLKQNQASTLGRLMSISHNGDRVAWDRSLVGRNSPQSQRPPSLGKRTSSGQIAQSLTQNVPTYIPQRRPKGEDKYKDLEVWAKRASSQNDLANFSGAYGCSLPELDRIVDTMCGLPGVEGAQLAGAGLGGCIMALVQKARASSVIQALNDKGMKSEIFRPISGASSLPLV